jgi:hypothetical protein
MASGYWLLASGSLIKKEGFLPMELLVASSQYH